MTQDPIKLAGGLNSYAYVENNPIGWVDPLGLKGLPGKESNTGKVPNGVPLGQQKFDEILNTEKGLRPNPSDYLPQEYIDAHLAQFENGASYFVPTNSLDKYGRNILGMPDNTQFVLPTTAVDDVIRQSKGNIAELEKIMGIPNGSWQGKDLSIIDIHSTADLKLRMPSGNEFGANSEWLPGGRLPTGMSEAVINNIPKGSYTERKF